MHGLASHTFSGSLRWRQRASGMAATALVVAVLVSVVTGCRSQEHFFDVTGELLVPSAREHYDEAVRMATDWNRDAYLVRVRADIASSSGVAPTGGHLTYMFDSHTSPTKFYVARLTEGTWTSEVIEQLAGVTDPSIRADDWVLDSVDAWRIALANGGEAFLIEHQEPLTSMDATLLYRTIRDDENVLVWDVDFLILFGPRLLLMIDPKTRDILEVITR